jgi:hypothetical protein
MELGSQARAWQPAWLEKKHTSGCMPVPPMENPIVSGVCFLWLEADEVLDPRMIVIH